MKKVFFMINQSKYIHIVLTLFLSILCHSVYSQWSTGAKIGIIKSKNKFYIDDEYFYSSDDIGGLEYGLFIKRNFKSGIEIGTEINFIQKGAKIDDIYEEKIDALETSFLVNYRFPLKAFSIYAGTGGFFQYFTNGIVTDFGSSEPYEYEYDFESPYRSRKEYGILVGGGLAYNFYQRHGVFLETRYRHSISYLVKDDPIEENGPFASEKNSGLGLYIGYSWHFGKN
jgi:hypothetical protein